MRSGALWTIRIPQAVPICNDAEAKMRRTLRPPPVRFRQRRRPFAKFLPLSVSHEPDGYWLTTTVASGPASLHDGNNLALAVRNKFKCCCRRRHRRRLHSRHCLATRATCAQISSLSLSSFFKLTIHKLAQLDRRQSSIRLDKNKVRLQVPAQKSHSPPPLSARKGQPFGSLPN